jgi:sugar/nucleoside kinase (ribokinase family)
LKTSDPNSPIIIPVLFLANIDPALQIDVVKKMKKLEFIGADTMNYWIKSKRDDLVTLFSMIDLLVINELEVRLFSGMDNVLKGAREILSMGVKYLVIKRGACGASLITKDDYFMIPAYPVDEVFDPTGAGDSFAGGMMGYIASTGRYDNATIRKAMVYGSVTASFNIQKFCTEGLEEMTNRAFNARLHLFQNMTKYDL